MNQTSQQQRNMKNVTGTFAIEGLTISAESHKNLERISAGKVTYQQVLRELRAKYEKRG